MDFIAKVGIPVMLVLLGVHTVWTAIVIPQINRHVEHAEVWTDYSQALHLCYQHDSEASCDYAEDLAQQFDVERIGADYYHP